MSNELEEYALVSRLNEYVRGGKLDWGDEELAANIILELRAEVNLAKKESARAWWRGVNDQWRHVGQGARLLEFKNPYGWRNR